MNEKFNNRGMQGLFDRDLIIHPGETIDELLLDRGMSQRELASMCGGDRNTCQQCYQR